MAVNIRETKIGLAYKKQSALGTANVAGDMWLLNKMNAELGNVEYATEPNNDIGLGTDFVTEIFKNGKNTSFALEKPASSQFMAWAMAFGLGKTTMTNVGSVYTYTSVPLVPDTDGDQPPAFTYMEALRPGTAGELFNRAMIGNVVNDWTLSVEKGSERSATRIRANCIGTGKTSDANTIVFPSTSLSESRLPSASATVSVNGTDYVAGGLIESIEVNYNNNIRQDTKVYPGSGLQDGFAIGGRMEIGDRRTPSVTLTARASAGSPELTKLKNLTEGTCVLTLTGDLISGSDYHSTSLTFHRVTYSSVTLGNANGIVTVQVNVMPMWHSTNGLMTAVTKTTVTGIGQ